MTPTWQTDDGRIQLYHADCMDALEFIDPASVNCCVTSPPYFGLRDYKLPPSIWPDGWSGCLGLEPTPQMYVDHIVAVFREMRRVLRDDGTLWLNLGDSYNAYNGNRGDSKSISGSNGAKHPEHPRGLTDVRLKNKDLIGIPWRAAFALQSDGWYLRSDIIWHKPAPMPESVTDRPTKAHEYLFLLSKSARYFYDAAAIAEPSDRAGQLAYYGGGNGERAASMGRPASGNEAPDKKLTATCPEVRNRRSVWSVATQPYPEAHFATFPPALIEPCIKAGSPMDGVVLDPFTGSGTTGAVSAKLGRGFVGCEMNGEYMELAKRRLQDELARTPLFDVAAKQETQAELFQCD